MARKKREPRVNRKNQPVELKQIDDVGPRDMEAIMARHIHNKTAKPPPPKELQRITDEESNELLPEDELIEYGTYDRQAVLKVYAEYVAPPAVARAWKGKPSRRYWKYAYEKPMCVEPKIDNRIYNIYLGDVNDRDYCYDELDVKLLNKLNKYLEAKGMPEISTKEYEVMFTRLDRAAFLQHFINEKWSGVVYLRPDHFQRSCNVCNSDMTTRSNRLLECYVCHIVVHQECYGVPCHPIAQWACRTCNIVSTTRPVCAVCPLDYGPLKQTTSIQNVHMLCAMWTDGVAVTMNQHLEPIDMMEDFCETKTCDLCEIRYGMTIMCDDDACETCFHASCAELAGYHMTTSVSGDGNNVHRKVLCYEHTKPAIKSDLAALKNMIKQKIKKGTETSKPMVAEIKDHRRVMNPNQQDYDPEILDFLYCNYLRRRTQNNGSLLSIRFADLADRVYRMRCALLKNKELVNEPPEEYRFRDNRRHNPNLIYDNFDTWRIVPTSKSMLPHIQTALFTANSMDSFLAVFYNFLIDVHLLDKVSECNWQKYMPTSLDPLEQIKMTDVDYWRDHVELPRVQASDIIGFLSFCSMPYDYLIGIFIAGLIFLDDKEIFTKVNTTAPTPMNLTIMYEKYLRKEYKLLHDVYDDFHLMMSLVYKGKLAGDILKYVQRFEDAACYVILSPTYLEIYRSYMTELGFQHDDPSRIFYYLLNVFDNDFEIPMEERFHQNEPAHAAYKFIYECCLQEKTRPLPVYYMVSKMYDRRLKFAKQRDVTFLPQPKYGFNIAFNLRFHGLKLHFMYPKKETKGITWDNVNSMIQKNLKMFGYSIFPESTTIVKKENMAYKILNKNVFLNVAKPAMFEKLDHFDEKRDLRRQKICHRSGQRLFAPSIVQTKNFGHNTMVMVERCALGKNIAGRAIDVDIYEDKYGLIARKFKRGRILVQFTMQDFSGNSDAMEATETTLESISWERVSVVYLPEVRYFVEKNTEYWQECKTVQSMWSMIRWYDSHNYNAKHDFIKNEEFHSASPEDIAESSSDSDGDESQSDDEMEVDNDGY